VTVTKALGVTAASIAGLVAVAILLLVLLAPSTILEVANATTDQVTVRVANDVNESYPALTIAASSSSRLEISGRDKLIWVVVDFPDGTSRESQKVYSSTGLTTSAIITRERVDLAPASGANQTVERDAPQAARRSP